MGLGKISPDPRRFFLFEIAFKPAAQLMVVLGGTYTRAPVFKGPFFLVTTIPSLYLLYINRLINCLPNNLI